MKGASVNYWQIRLFSLEIILIIKSDRFHISYQALFSKMMLFIYMYMIVCISLVSMHGGLIDAMRPQCQVYCL